MNTLSRIGLVALAATLVGVSAPGAAVEPQTQSVVVKTRNVRFDDLNLTRPVDAKTLLNRIRSATYAVCRRSGELEMHVVDAADRKRCMDATYRVAVAQVDDRLDLDIEAIAARISAEQNLEARR